MYTLYQTGFYLKLALVQDTMVYYSNLKSVCLGAHEYGNFSVDIMFHKNILSLFDPDCDCTRLYGCWILIRRLRQTSRSCSLC